jgi:hypothetical protein
MISSGKESRKKSADQSLCLRLASVSRTSSSTGSPLFPVSIVTSTALTASSTRAAANNAGCTQKANKNPRRNTKKKKEFEVRNIRGQA